MKNRLRVFLFLLLFSLSVVGSGYSQTAQAPAASAHAQNTTADPWWKHAVIYEIYPRSFQDSNGDGVGDMNGITQRLDYLKDLGVDAIWITPMYPSPQVDFGYDIADYTAFDPQYGTMADFERLVKEAKARNIRVIMDFVANHTSDKNAWFIESRSSGIIPSAIGTSGVMARVRASRRTTGSRGLDTRRGSSIPPPISIITTTSTTSSPT